MMDMIKGIMDIVCRTTDIYLTCMFVIGAVCVLKFTLGALLSLWSGFRAYYVAQWGLFRTNIRKHGEWAIITGASEGIGRGYALELARQGFNIVIMSRSTEKLKNVENEIRSQYNCDVRIIPVDFTQGQSVYTDIQAEISDLDIGVLVNNVGLAEERVATIFIEKSEQHHRAMIEVNCQAMVQMTHLVLPKMAENRRGIIVNLSSTVIFKFVPFSIIYNASKHFVKNFSTSLQYEYRNRGIIVQCVCPGLVTTTMTRSLLKKPNIFSPDPVKYARSAVATIGVQHLTTGYMAHDIQNYFLSFIPDSLFCKIVELHFKRTKKNK